MKQNMKAERKKIKSYIKEYIEKNNNYDNSELIYTTRYTGGSFSIKRPSNKYTNCEIINGYPHFEIPLKVILKELESFINKEPLYNENFCLRYGDTHPNKPIPMLAQMRNIFIGDIINSMILTSGQKLKIYTIGDISEKTIKTFANNFYNSEEIFLEIFNNIMENPNLNNEINQTYKKYCAISKNMIDSFLRSMYLDPDIYFYESDLYKKQILYFYIKNGLKFEDGIKENGGIRYFLQELMFILNPDLNSFNIINIIGSDQSNHVKEVFKVLSENRIIHNAKYLFYGICKNAHSRNIDEWSAKLIYFIEKNNYLLNGELIDYQDFLRIIICGLNNKVLIDYNNLDNMNNVITMADEIFRSLEIAHKNISGNTFTVETLPFISKMSLVRQELDNAIYKGEQSKFFRFLYEVAKEYNLNHQKYIGINDLYTKFMVAGLDCLSLTKTKAYDKMLRRERKLLK